MIKMLSKHKDGWAVVIDKPILDQLEIDADTPLELTTEGRTLIITPVNASNRSKQLKAALEKTNNKYGRILKRLGE